MLKAKGLGERRREGGATKIRMGWGGGRGKICEGLQLSHFNRGLNGMSVTPKGVKVQIISEMTNQQ